jgi:phospholipase/carboxylesterase
LRARTAGDRQHPRQLVVLLHGWGAPGDDLVPLGEELAAPGRLFVFPEAPLAAMAGGRAWWPLDLARMQSARQRGEERALRQETPPGLPEARARVTALIRELTQQTGVHPTAVLIGGFSQGAMVATDVTLASPGLSGGLIVLSGSITAEGEWGPRVPRLAPGLPVFMSHGRLDPVLPFPLAEALRDLFVGAHHPVTWVPFDGGHGIPGPVLTKLESFLAANATAASSAAH